MFNLYTNNLPKSCDPIMLQSFKTNVIMYADELVLMSQTKEGLQKCLDMHDDCEKWKIVDNIDKTKIIVFNKNGQV